jgi:hypothetical protein
LFLGSASLEDAFCNRNRLSPRDPHDGYPARPSGRRDRGDRIIR